MGYIANLRQMVSHLSVKTVTSAKLISASKTQRNCAAVIFISVIAASASAPALAQTEYQIRSANADLETEYYQELDKWMLRAYEGDRDAQFRVGVLFASDQFDQPNAEQAVYWYKQASRQGHILAQYNLGHHLLTGNGAEKNELDAISWWKEAAKEDHALAQFNVGRAYYLGIGVQEDHEQSRYWFARAAQNKEEKSIEVLQQLGWADDLPTQPVPDYKKTIAKTPTQITSTIESTGLALTSSINATQTAGTTPFVDTTYAVETISSEADVSVSTPKVTSQTPESNSSTVSSGAGSDASQIVTMPVALYTDPAVRSVLIAIVDDRESLNVIESNKDWVTVRSQDGFPVWVHGNYVTVKSDKATINGSNVNARSVPMVSEGTIVGRLNNDQELTVLDQQNAWYRLTSPNSFTAWIKAEDYNRSAIVNTTASVKKAADETTMDETTPKERVASTEKYSANDSSLIKNAGNTMVDVNDNAWLFSQAKESYTLQLASFDEQQKVNEFLTNNDFSDDSQLHRFTSSSKDITWTYFLYGSFSNRQDAEITQQEIKQNRAWIRSFGRLQENRCLSWKTKLPTPPELNQYCN